MLPGLLPFIKHWDKSTALLRDMDVGNREETGTRERYASDDGNTSLPVGI